MVKMFVEGEKGSKIKNVYNEETLEFIDQMELNCDRPFPYGFIPGTVGDDGDCIDIWLITEGNPESGTIVECEVSGLLEFFEEEEKDFKVLGIPVNETIEVTDEIVAKIKNYTMKVFTQFPEVQVSFGSLLSEEEAIRFIQS